MAGYCFSVSLPGPPTSLSLPPPPFKVSRPGPPTSLSAAEPPRRMSSPRPPSILSLSAPPLNLSSRLPPTMESKPNPPSKTLMCAGAPTNLSSEYSVGSLALEMAWISIGQLREVEQGGHGRRSLDSPQVATVGRTVVDGNAADGDLAVARAARYDFPLAAIDREHTVGEGAKGVRPRRHEHRDCQRERRADQRPAG
jgi:hypothetical protein